MDKVNDCCCYEIAGDNPECKVNHEHQHRHALLHVSLDELVVDFIKHTDKRPSTATVLDLMAWSSKQTENPEE